MGVSLVVIGVNAAVITWLIRRYRRKKAAWKAVARYNEAQASTSRVESHREPSGSDQMIEMDGNGRRFEVSSNRPPAHELAVHEEIRELPS
jgi:hypothetical protein